MKFKASLAVMPGIVKAGADFWTLPRTNVGNCSLERFKAILSDYMRWYAYLSIIKRNIILKVTTLI